MSPHARPYQVPDVSAKVRDTDWTLRAACRGIPESKVSFFPERTRGRYARSDLRRKIRSALAVCDTCPVTAECLRRAIAFGVEDGIWGGVVFGPQPVRHIPMYRQLQNA